MLRNTHARPPILTILVLPLLLCACEKPAPPAPAATDPGPVASETPAWILASEPADASGVLDAKSSAVEGDAVVIRARIGGRKAPLSPGSPAFTVIDLGLPHCGENPADSCRTPWDYCCETPETITSNSATIQIVGPDGRPIAEDASSGGLKPLDEVVLVGTVGPRPSADVLIVLATGIYRVTK